MTAKGSQESYGKWADESMTVGEGRQDTSKDRTGITLGGELELVVSCLCHPRNVILCSSRTLVSSIESPTDPTMPLS
jgi:hypothetical protein